MSFVKIRCGATDGVVKTGDGLEHHIFGFVDLTGVPDSEIFKHRGKAQLLAPALDVTVGDKVELSITNLGLTKRPDLDESLQPDWRIPPNRMLLRGEIPKTSISVPFGCDLVYRYEPKEPGTYIYYCPFEPVERIQMGMVGPLIARPADYDATDSAFKTAYGTGTDTTFDREYLLLCSELDLIPHVQSPDTQPFNPSKYSPAYRLLNQRSYPDTINTTPHTHSAKIYSGTVEANAGERVLLRFVNLGLEQHVMTILGLSMRIIGRDAQLMRGPNGEDLSYWRDVLHLAAGHTIDAVILPQQPAVYPLFNRGYHKNTNAGTSPGGMVTYVLARPAGTLSPQVMPGL